MSDSSKARTNHQEVVVVEVKNVRYEEKSVVAIPEDLSVVKVTDSILRDAILKDATDIHIEPTEDTLIVRYRIDGVLHDMAILPKAVFAGVVARIKLLGNLSIDECRLPQNGQLTLESDEYSVSFFVSTLPVFDGEKITIRLSDESGKGIAIDDLGFSRKNIAIFKENITKSNGMILVTGPAGSGKTTTLYTALQERTTEEVSISTIEDPIQYRMQRVSQTRVQPNIGLTFSHALRAIVRQDPDIIMVGEIQDPDTASLAVNAALTGHLVLSALNTSSSVGAISRLLRMNIEPFLIASTMNIIIAQRLVRTLCTYCRKQAMLDEAILESLDGVVDRERMLELLQEEGVVDATATSLEALPIFQAGGCDRCHAGYRGRVGMYEVLEITPSLQALITANATSDALEDAAKKQGMVTMLEDGVMKVAQGITSVEEILRVAKE